MKGKSFLCKRKDSSSSLDGNFLWYNVVMEQNCNATNRRLVDAVCLYCGNPFKVRQSETNKGRGKFCTHKCSLLYRNYQQKGKIKTVRIRVNCAWCSKEFDVLPKRLAKSKSGLLFCSRKCKDEAQCIGGIQAIQPPHYDNGESDYRKIAHHHLLYKCVHCGYDRFPILECHHKDSNRNNNQLENLEWLCPNCHDEQHYIQRTGRWRNTKQAEIEQQ